VIPDQSMVKSTRDRYASRAPQRDQTERTLRAGGSPLVADSPERVNKRLSHIQLSEMARATASPAERAAFGQVVVANADAGLQAFAFVLEQDLSAVAFREEFAVNAVWAEHLVRIADLEQMLDGIEFPKAVKDADQFGGPVADEITRRHLESLGGAPSA
jgi:hypothetical protein